MLKCKELANLASDYLDRNLGWQEAVSVRLHTFICVHCRRFLRHLLLAVRTAQGLQRQSASAGEISRIIHFIAGKKQA